MHWTFLRSAAFRPRPDSAHLAAGSSAAMHPGHWSCCQSGSIMNQESEFWSAAAERWVTPSWFWHHWNHFAGSSLPSSLPPLSGDGSGLRHESEQRFKSSTRLNTLLTSLWAGRNWRLKAPHSWTSSRSVCEPHGSITARQRQLHRSTRSRPSHIWDATATRRKREIKETEVDKRAWASDGIRERSRPHQQEHHMQIKNQSFP